MLGILVSLFLQFISSEPIVYASDDVYTYSAYVTPSQKNVIADISIETPPPVPSGGVSVSCVTAVREFGANVPKGDAKDLETNSIPVLGGVVKLKYGESVDEYHLAYIMAILKTGIYVKERCFKDKSCETIEERFISFDDPSIQGFWYEK